MKTEIVQDGDGFEVWVKLEEDEPARQQAQSLIVGAGRTRAAAILDATRELKDALEDLERALPL